MTRASCALVGFLTVRLGHTLKLVLLLDGVRVGRALGGVDELVGKALSNALHVAEGRLTGTRGQERDRLVHPTERRHIDGLATDSALRADTSRVLARAGVDNSVHQDLDGVGVRQEVDDLKGVSDDADSHELLAIVTAVEHERVNQPLNNGHLSLTELLRGVTAGRVWRVHSVAERDVV